ncbi:MAG: SUMF1/EgtB/PvdO family nonheme iron enzyme [Verrucomicrobiales bacterium]|nr:SUMF1/EgtB/PvdO family nonheme iron enzyme [Verrucomicrobiales bacterium]
MKLRSIFLAAFFFPCVGWSADRVALVIGNGNYTHVPTLENPANDAREVSALLRADDYQVTEVIDGTVKQMGVALRTFALAGREASTAVFYYAGHGFEVAGKNYLAPVDAELVVDDSLANEALDAALGFALDDETLPLESVLGELRKQVPGLKVVVLDCCRDNPFARTRSWARSRSGAGGLAQVTEAQLPEGTMLVFSGEPGQQVPDGTGNHSPFAEALLGEMRSSAGSPMLTVFTGVATKVKGRQKPWIKFDGTGQSLHAFSTVALMSRGVPVAVKVEETVSSAEMAKMKAELDAALAKLAAADGNVAEMAKLQKELEEARSKMGEATTTPAPPAPVPMVKTDPTTAGAFPASRGMEGSRAGEVREFGGIEMVWCPPGDFLMGSRSDEEDRSDDETQHRVTLTKGFWMAKTECTQGKWEAMMGTDVNRQKAKGDSYGDVTGEGANHPMYFVNWEDAQEYLTKMNSQNALPSGWKWALPTEAQWEYACRAGTETKFAGDLDEIAWYSENSGSKTNPVGTKKPNDWGLYDMHGNVWEWCSDYYGDYASGSATNPKGATTGSIRVGRGGGWFFIAAICRSAIRHGDSPEYRYDVLGFRLAAVPEGR